MHESIRTSGNKGAAFACLMALAGWAQADGIATAPDTPREVGNKVVACGSAAAPAVDLVWQDASAEGGVSTASGYEVTLRIGNHLDRELRARTEITVNTPGGVVRRRLPDVRIAPHGSTLVPVSLEEWASSPPAGTSFALAFAEAWAADDNRIGRAAAAPLYFHDDRGTFVVYGESALRQRFHGRASTPAGATLEMTSHGGSGERHPELEPRDEVALQDREQALSRVPAPKGEEQ
jgi:hypothetical protein